MNFSKFACVAAAAFVAVVILATIVNAAVSPASAIIDTKWTAAGPSGALGVNSLTMATGSAANSIVKTGNGNWLIGTVNGGVWKTTGKPTDENALWTPVFDSDSVTCNSIAVLYKSPQNGNRIYAGCGISTSSAAGYTWVVSNSGDLSGFAVSEDNGDTWTMARGFPAGHSVQSFVELPSGELLVASRGQFMKPSEGGIFKVASYQNVNDTSMWSQVYNTLPVFSLRYDTTSKMIFASTAEAGAASAVLFSNDKGSNWKSAGKDLKFVADFFAGYSQLEVDVTGRNLFLLTMLGPEQYVKNGLLAGAGGVWRLDLSNASLTPDQVSWQQLGAMPIYSNDGHDCTLTEDPTKKGSCRNYVDQDWAEKDRAAIKIDGDILYVSGNANWLMWRVDWKKSLNYSKYACSYDLRTFTSGPFECINKTTPSSIWLPMYNYNSSNSKAHQDTENDAVPHVDTRDIYLDDETNSLILLSDGGAYTRTFPKVAGKGKWTAWNHRNAMEIINLAYDGQRDIVVAPAQDNDVQLSPRGISDDSVASKQPYYGAAGLGCDGANAMADSAHGRAWGACQSAEGLMWLDLDKEYIKARPTLNFAQFASRGFPTLSGTAKQAMNAVDFFQVPVRLNRKNPFSLYTWYNISSYGGTATTGGVYSFDVSKNDGTGPNATLVMPTGGEAIQSIVAGGVVDSTLREDVLVAMSQNYLFTKVAGVTTKHAFPTAFSTPCAAEAIKSYCDLGVVEACAKYCQSWPSHSFSIQHAVHQMDSSVVAATGWPTVNANGGVEHIYFTRNSGKNFVDIMGNLKTQVGTQFKVRMMGLEFVGKNSLVVGTVNGLFATDIVNVTLGATGAFSAKWYRVGDKRQFPMVRASKSIYDVKTDRLVVATIGRGVYILNKADALVATAANDGVLPPNHPDHPNNKNPPKKKSKVVEIVVPIVCVVLVIVGILYWRKTKSSGGDGVHEAHLAEGNQQQQGTGYTQQV